MFTNEIFSIDIGFHSVKCARLYDDGTPYHFSFPAIAATEAEIIKQPSDDDVCKPKLFRVKVSNTIYYVGEDISKQISPFFTKLIDSGYATTDQYRALVLGALSKLCDAPGKETGEIIVIPALVLSLPYIRVSSDKPALQAYFSKILTLADERRIRFEKVYIFDQPTLVYIDHLVDNFAGKYKKTKHNDILVLDPGEGTLDWVVLDANGSRSDNRSGTLAGGMHEIKLGLMGLVSKLTGERHENTQLITRFYDKQKWPSSLTEDNIAAIQSAAKDLAIRQLKSVQNSVKSFSDIDTIVIGGACAPIYEAAIKSLYPSIETVTMTRFAVANGGLKGGILHALEHGIISKTSCSIRYEAPPLVVSRPKKTKPPTDNSVSENIKSDATSCAAGSDRTGSSGQGKKASKVTNPEHVNAMTNSVESDQPECEESA